MAKTPKTIKFVCSQANCPNLDVEYIWGDSSATVAECGGCGATLQAIEVTA